jgi:uncharacterized protein with HEPN domain
VSRHDRERLADVVLAIEAIHGHVERGDLADGLVFDAVRVRLIEIGEAVKSISRELLDHEPEIAWADIAAMRNHLAHRYFDTDHAIVRVTLDHDLPPLAEAVARLLNSLA